MPGLQLEALKVIPWMKWARSIVILLKRTYQDSPGVASLAIREWYRELGLLRMLMGTAELEEVLGSGVLCHWGSFASSQPS